MPAGPRPTSMKRQFLLAATCLAGVAVAAVPAMAQQYGPPVTPPAPTPTPIPVPISEAVASCDKFAAPGGSDGAAGTAASPYRTAQKLQDSLRPGQVGCLKPGATFAERLRGNTSGRPGAPITMTSGPGPGRATLLGEIFIPDGTADINYQNLKINGRTAFRVNPSVNGDRIGFFNNEITDEHTGICFHLGKPGAGVAEGIVIDGNRIHGCGRLPATGFDHGIYLNSTRNVRITNNYIYDNADYGIHLYPNAQGSFIANNVIDGNGRGVTFSGEGSTASSNNVVVNNIISNSKNTTNLESYWGGPVGSGNRAEGNCLWNGARGNIGTQRGFTVSGSVVADPMFVNRAAGNFALRSGSRCSGKGPGNPLPAGAPAGSGGTPATGRTLTLSTSWLTPSRLRVTARVGTPGRVTITVASAGRRLSRCVRDASAARPAVCRLAAPGVTGRRTAVISAVLDPSGPGANVRARLERNAPGR